jgi:hypothetical protein
VLVTTAHTVFGVRLTTVISRLPAGADDGCPADPSVPATGLRVLFPDAPALTDGEAETEADADGEGEAAGLWPGAEGEGLRGPDGSAAASRRSAVGEPPFPDGAHAPYAISTVTVVARAAAPAYHHRSRRGDRAPCRLRPRAIPAPFPVLPECVPAYR